MLTRSFLQFNELFAQLPKTRPVSPRSVFMVMPEEFQVDAESALDNVYMDINADVDPQRALAQARGLAAAIEACGVPVHCFPGRERTPDAVFPNNVFGTIPGRFIVGSMFHSGRQLEAKREDIRAHFTADGQRELYDLSCDECVAELTGPLVIDRARGVGLCGMSNRVDEFGAELMHQAFDLNLTLMFDLSPFEYHTNVVLAVLASRACVLHANAFADPMAPNALAAAYPQRTLWLSDEEKEAFAANCIALTESDLFMSATAVAVLRADSRAALESWGFRIHPVAVDELEKAGGSLRCMVGEVY
jgi:hypothetical protein